MSGLFLTGKIKTLLDRLTSTRAAALDEVTSTRMARLDATVSSRQSEASALSRYNELYVGRMKSIQTGYVSSLRSGTSTGEAASYLDVTITAVSDITRCVVLFQGMYSTNANGVIAAYASSSTDLDASVMATAYLTSTTNLRLAAATTENKQFMGRWTVIEFT